MLSCYVAIMSASSVFAVGEGIKTKAQSVESNFWSFIQDISWYIAPILIIVLLLLKQKAATQGDSQQEGIFTKGIWTVVLLQITIQVGPLLMELFKDLF